MGCKEFRRLNWSDAALVAMGRTRRAECARHWRACRACRAWVESQPPDDPKADNRREGQELARRDMRAGRRLEGS